MSILSVTPAQRRRTLGRAVTAAPDPTLAGMARGQRAYVVSIDAADDPAAARRLFELGFVPGAEVQMVRRAPLADPVVFRVAGYEIALRHAQARWVTVSALPS